MRQAGPAAFILGLGPAALGGSMVPLEVFPSVARRIAQLTPHYFEEGRRHGRSRPAAAPPWGWWATVLVAAWTLVLGLHLLHAYARIR